MGQFKRVTKYILSKFSKVQIVLIVVLGVCCFVISDSNVFARVGYDIEISDLKGQIKYYREKIDSDKRKLNELQSNRENIEKFARENYKMKKENEEVFVIE